MNFQTATDEEIIEYVSTKLVSDDSITLLLLNMIFEKAVVDNRYKLVDHFILNNKLFDPCSNNDHAIKLAAKREDFSMIKTLLANSRVDPSVEDNIIIVLASTKGDVELVRQLLADKRVDPTAYKNRALRYACTNGKVDVAKLLLEDPRTNPLDVFNGGDSALDTAMLHKQLDLVKLMIAKVDISKINNSTVINFVEKMEEEKLSADQKSAKEFEKLLTKHNLNGVLRTSEGKLMLIKPSEVNVI